MKNYRFYLSTLEALYSYGLVDQIDSIFEFMRHQIENGNSIIIEKNHIKTENSTIIFFHDISELNRFHNEFTKKNCPPLNVLLKQRHKGNANIN